MNVQLISVAAILAVLIGCPETPDETAVDVALAREDAAQDVNETRRDAVDVGVATTEAKGSYDVAKAKCDALNGDDKTACVSTANATAIRDAARERAERFDH